MADLTAWLTIGGAVSTLTATVVWVTTERRRRARAARREDERRALADLVEARAAESRRLVEGARASEGERRRAGLATLAAAGWTVLGARRAERRLAELQAELTWPDDGTAIDVLVAHAPSQVTVAAFTIGRRPSAAPTLGDEAFDAEVSVTDPSFGGVSRIVGWLDAPTRTAVGTLVAAGWVSGARGWRRQFGDTRVAPAELAAEIERAAALVRRLPLPPGTPHAAPIAALALRDPQAAVRVTALEVLADRWRDDPATAAALRDLVARPPTHAAERRAVAALLAHHPIPGGEAVLVRWLADDDRDVAAAAGDALALVGSALAIPALRRKGLKSAIEAIQRRIGSGPAGGLSLSDPNATGALALAEAAKEGQDA